MSETANRLVCVDASLLLWALVPSPLSDRSLALLKEWQDRHMQLIAPALLPFEVTSVLRRLVYLEELTQAEGEAAFVAFQRIEIRLSHRRSIFPLAWNLAKRFNRPRAYDTAYIALAQLENCDFWTADGKLFDAVHNELSWVHWVGETEENRR